MSVSSMKTIVNHLKTSNNVKLKVPIFAVLILAFLQRVTIFALQMMQNLKFHGIN